MVKINDTLTDVHRSYHYTSSVTMNVATERLAAQRSSACHGQVTYRVLGYQCPGCFFVSCVFSRPLAQLVPHLFGFHTDREQNRSIFLLPNGGNLNNVARVRHLKPGRIRSSTLDHLAAADSPRSARGVLYTSRRSTCRAPHWIGGSLGVHEVPCRTSVTAPGSREEPIDQLQTTKTTTKKID